MKIVKEHINEKFSQNSDPIEDMNIGHNYAMFKDLEKRGIKFNFEWDGGEFHKKETINNIEELTYIIDKLEDVGFDVKKMKMYRSTDIQVEVVQVLSSNRVIVECATLEDANIIIDILRKFSMYQYETLNKSIGESYVSLNPSKHIWLDKLVENRNKYRIDL